MKRFFKIIGALIGGLIVLATVVLAGLYVYDQYKQNTFKHIEEVDGVYLGMPRGDLLFKTGLDMRCSPEETGQTECNFFRYLNPSLRYGYSKDDFFVSGGIIRLEDDKVVALEKHVWIPRDLETQGYNSDALMKKLGAPDLLVVSKDLTNRTYVYVDQNLTFKYGKDSLGSFNWGKSYPLELGLAKTNISDKMDFYYTYEGSEVVVGGATVCPGVSCPFEEGERLEYDNALYSLEQLVRVFSD